MGKNELAYAMLEWSRKTEALEALTDEIEGAVLELGETVTVGDVKATYKAGRKSYDYVAGGTSASAKIVSAYTTKKTVEQTNWREVCKEAGIVDVPYTQSDPSVKVKICT